MLHPPYSKHYESLSQLLPTTRLIHDELRTLAYGTDASFYRLIPKLLVRVESENEVVAVLRDCRALKIPLTFRAGGTSLSGQSLSDSVLVQLGPSWRGLEINSEGSEITLQPGVIGSHANIRLQPYQRKIGPDPASINSAMIGGIAANNSSGMCCGTAQNTYNTVSGMRIIFVDGAILDTRRLESRQEFSRTHAQMLGRVRDLAQRTKGNHALADRIRRKFKMKNTTGYSLNALVDFDDPIEIIEHLMIGSEGTLGFIAEITYQTVPDLPFKASSLMLFPDIKTACQATTLLRSRCVAAVEIMDRASLRSVENKAGMPGYLKLLAPATSALLVETRAETCERLREQIHETTQSLQALPTLRPLSFTEDKTEYTQLWNIRKGLFPSIGAIREIGTTVIIEDVAFPIDRLAAATLELQDLFRKHGYSEAIIFGHALEGNLHFVFTQDFNDREEVSRYQAFIDNLTQMVVHTYDGSLKAEHGTGRNMAPFVELEWGREAYQLMQEIKEIFDPEHLLNPGVILNRDPLTHVKNLKPLPRAHALVDRCIECGFCEVNCPSRDLTLTPRQRIVVWREISRLSASEENPSRLVELKRAFKYQGDKTCATDGLCATSCPVNIDTGRLIKDLRALQHSRLAELTATLIARNMALTASSLRILLDLADFAHWVLGPKAMDRGSSLARRLSGNRLPLWNRQMPRAADSIVSRAPDHRSDLKAVYFPSCISRTFGVARGSLERQSQSSKIDALLHKAGYDVIYPPGLSRLCCGMPFASKGFARQGDWKLEQLENAVLEASSDGKFPVLIDTSPCLYRMKESLRENQKLQLLEPAEFILKFLVPRLRFKKSPATVAVHAPCSSVKLGLDFKLRKLAQLCSEVVVVPDNVGCCGFAGDKGFSDPELTASALNSIKGSLPRNCRAGYSTSKTCEIGLSLHSGIPYQSIAYLVDECTEADP
jgi:D-lactate dehydrogenase